MRIGRRWMHLGGLILAFLLLASFGRVEADAPRSRPDYARLENWAYRELFGSGKAADVFFVGPTVRSGDAARHNMAMDDREAKRNFIGAINMERGLYDGDARFFAPYYRIACLNVYEMPEEERKPYLAFAYADVKEAFAYYLAHYNGGRPIILAGFSQGSDHVLRLMKDFFEDDARREQLVAAYAIGWAITEEELRAHPRLRFASGERDTGVIVSFNSEAEGITSSLLIPAGQKALAINPLNWQTGTGYADRALNRGACFPDNQGHIRQEIPELTGAYIDGARGALKVTDVDPDEYPPVLSFFAPGVYHIYDYQFFYRNLQENVAARLAAYRAEHGATDVSCTRCKK